jgi:DNA-binding NtrC family response regulator
MSRHVLIIDDDLAVLGSLSADLRARGFRVNIARNGAAALSAVDQDPPDVILLDLRLGNEYGLDVLQQLHEGRDTIPPVIMISAEGTIGEAVEAVHRGAIDFIEKPLGGEQVSHRIRQLLETVELRRANRDLSDRVGDESGLIGTSEAIRKILETVQLVAPTSAPVLITGESGTGKELVARALHATSPRAGESFIAVNCSAIPKDLVESELFGHQRGAFTGALQTRRGAFETASGGTLLLDEIGDMPMGAQPKLLRALEEHEIQRVGSDKPIPIDARVVASTNRDLRRAMQDGNFREDLFHRLNVVELSLPPLRERTEDIPVLADHFLRLYAKHYNRAPLALEDEAHAVLRKHPFTGNVRELRNLMERLTILSRSARVSASELRALGGLAPTERPSATPVLQEGDHALRNTLRDVERAIVQRTLNECDWRMAHAAQRLGLERSHLYRKLKELDIELAGRTPKD